MITLIRRLLILLILLCLVAFILRNTLIIQALKFATSQETGFTLNIVSVDFSHFQPAIIYGFDARLDNPDDFEVPDALRVSRITAEFPPTFWTNLDRPRIQTLTLDISEFSIVRNSVGKLNVLAMNEIARKSPKKIRSQPLIAELNLSVEKVLYYDCFGMTPGAVTKPSPIILDINLKNLRYKNIEGIPQLEQLIIREVLRRAPIKELTDEYQALGIEH